MKQSAVAIIRNNKNEILLLYRKYSPFGFGLPGGKMEPIDEGNVFNTVQREVFEETDFTLDRSNIVFKYNHLNASKTSMVSVYEYKSELIHLYKPTISSEHRGYIWAKEEELINLPLAGNTLNFITGKQNQKQVKMKYSKNPEDWYYTIDPELNFICLSTEPDQLDDELTDQTLPKSIKTLLKPLGVDVNCSIQESTFDLDSYNGAEEEITVQELESKLNNLGFKKSNIVI